MAILFPDLPVGAILQHWDARPHDWRSVTEADEYEDGGEDFNEVSNTAPKRWRLEIVIPAGSHTAAKAVFDQYDLFFDAVRYSQPFIFTDKYGTAWSDVRIEEYDRTHDAHRSWIVFVRFTLKGSISTSDVTLELSDVPDGEILVDG
jgi:hypothetical protein